MKLIIAFLVTGLGFVGFSAFAEKTAPIVLVSEAKLDEPLQLGIARSGYFEATLKDGQIYPYNLADDYVDKSLPNGNIPDMMESCMIFGDFARGRAWYKRMWTNHETILPGSHSGAAYIAMDHGVFSSDGYWYVLNVGVGNNEADSSTYMMTCYSRSQFTNESLKTILGDHLTITLSGSNN